MVFAQFNQDALLGAMKRIWDKIAPPAMFTAAGNLAVANNESFGSALEMSKWNLTAEEAIAKSVAGNYGFSGSSAITSNAVPGTNGTPKLDANGNVIGWEDSNTQIRVPAGFAPMRGSNIQYSDQLPPFDVTLTFANEYGQCAFQKIYDIDILNEASGASVDTIVMEKQVTYIARRISPLVKGVYNRDEKGYVKGRSVIAAS